MRAYFFTNRYVAGIHTGIQSGHAIDQLWSKYVERFLTDQLSGVEPTFQDRTQFDMLRDFSKNHKTFICLNGGDHQNLLNLVDFLSNPNNPLPWMEFREPGLNDAITAVAVVVPELLYSEYADLWVAQANGQKMNFDQIIAIKQFEANTTAWERDFVWIRTNRPLAQ